MHIDSYEFGEIVINGARYDSDVLIIGDSIEDHWRRIQGHRLCPADLEPVITEKPSVLVVGCGAYGMMKVSRETRKALQEQDIKLETAPTPQAVERFNALTKTGANVAAALHLTC